QSSRTSSAPPGRADPNGLERRGATVWQGAAMSLRRAVLAVLPLLLLLVAAPANGRHAEPPAPPRLGIPRTYDAALAHFDHATEMRALKKFYTPSGNIYCNVGLTGYPRGCEINQ